MLEIKNVTKIFNKGTVNEKVALDDFSLTLEDGDFVTVIGGNGSGKSTMMNAIAGVWPVDEGSIVIDGIDVTKLPEHKRAKYLGRVFQDRYSSHHGHRRKSGVSKAPRKEPFPENGNHQEGTGRI